MKKDSDQFIPPLAGKTFENSIPGVSSWRPPLEDQPLPEPENEFMRHGDDPNPINLNIMTQREAVETDRLIRKHVFTLRYLLVEMKRREGWRMMGYPSFGEYGRRMTYINGDRFYQLIRSTEIASELGYGLHNAEMSPDEAYTRPLLKIPAKYRKEIWDSVVNEARAANRRVTAAKIKEAADEWEAKRLDHQRMGVPLP